jgi:hypothetical protein
LRRTVAGHPLYLWIIWLGVFLGVLCSPMLSADPAVCFYLLDPELLVLMLLIGMQHSRLQIALIRARIQDWLSRLRRPARLRSECALPGDTPTRTR